MLIDHESGVVSIDGQEFPWHLEAEGPVVDRRDDVPDFAVVHLPLLVLGAVEEITTFQQDLAWMVAEGERQREAALLEFRWWCREQRARRLRGLASGGLIPAGSQGLVVM
ncbi:hypothetical protein [Aeromicrobium sp. Root495]|uniref:hypothetical protein n=1 Tax=Aeromicrobium sp. Root495 TaxID=1736550 RepID=UPI00138EEF17|nr:hypothetical protein [Aeromicrobium sp. Root495]